MKNVKIAVSAFVICVLIASCSMSKQRRSYSHWINGNWQLQTIVTAGITDKINIQLFNEEDFNCFVGSSWNFNSSSGLGNYMISKNAQECANVKRDLRWVIYEAKDGAGLLQFKRLDDKQGVMDNDEAVLFTIVALNKTNMQLKTSIVFNDKPASLIYNFVKN